MKLVSNETQTSRVGIVKKLRKHGFDVCVDDIMTPCPAVVQVLQEGNLRPHLLVHPDALSEFFRVLMQSDQKLLFSLGRG